MAVVYELKTIAIQLCVTRLMELGLEEEGLFRLSAGQAKVDMSKLLIISTVYVIRNKNFVFEMILKLINRWRD